MERLLFRKTAARMRRLLVDMMRRMRKKK